MSIMKISLMKQEGSRYLELFCFDPVCLLDKPFENTVRKGEIAGNEHFLLSHSVFCLFWELSAIFIKFEIVFEFWILKILLFWKGLNLFQLSNLILILFYYWTGAIVVIEIG